MQAIWTLDLRQFPELQALADVAEFATENAYNAHRPKVTHDCTVTRMGFPCSGSCKAALADHQFISEAW